MEDFIYWTFETRHSDGFTYRFAVHEHEDGAMQITRISPYDETEYHWASKSAWRFSTASCTEDIFPSFTLAIKNSVAWTFIRGILQRYSPRSALSIP